MPPFLPCTNCRPLAPAGFGAADEIPPEAAQVPTAIVYSATEARSLTHSMNALSRNS